MLQKIDFMYFIDSVQPLVPCITGRHGHRAAKPVGVAIDIAKQCTSMCVPLVVGVVRSTW